ncbi:MAG: hypothetical protein ACK53K_02550 [Burkholderiales bacterium]|jgi:hypothetical protein
MEKTAARKPSPHEAQAERAGIGRKKGCPGWVLGHKGLLALKMVPNPAGKPSGRDIFKGS